MSRVTDVLVAIDTATILQKYTGCSKSADSPTLIDPKYVYMITNQDNAISGQAGGELDLKAQVGDLIRWRETSLSLGFETAAIFYRFIAAAPEQQQSIGANLSKSRELLLVVRDLEDRPRDLPLQLHDR
jgi:hypothetical protein